MPLCAGYPKSYIPGKLAGFVNLDRYSKISLAFVYMHTAQTKLKLIITPACRAKSSTYNSHWHDANRVLWTKILCTGPYFWLNNSWSWIFFGLIYSCIFVSQMTKSENDSDPEQYASYPSMKLWFDPDKKYWAITPWWDTRTIDTLTFITLLYSLPIVDKQRFEKNIHPILTL